MGIHAFPYNDVGENDWYGMELRDYFAARAMAVLLHKSQSRSFIADVAYLTADAMLEARKKRAETHR